ncbi:hypothetical protein CHS0354_014123 [Potamilus streckersoni]|uniref:Suppressor of cytokine signaling 7 n=1 Tax=Potamilus streckersoni TaxID=2493646 RepID=A0AAE0TK23_9BIVA|nr:hypothetical protein CHS0354_014123 [Potamilus streckersoni]
MEPSPRSATLPSNLRHSPPDLSTSDEGSGFLAKLRRKFRFKRSGKYDVSLNMGESNNVSIISFQKNDDDLPSSSPPDSVSASKGIKNRPARSYSDRGQDSSSRKRLKFNSKGQGVLHGKSPELLSNGQEPLHSRDEKEFRNLIGGRIADSGNGNNYSPVFSCDSRKVGIKYKEIQSSGEHASVEQEEYKPVTVEDGIENNCIIPDESAVDLDKAGGLMSNNTYADEPGYESLDDIRKKMKERQVKSDSNSQLPDQYSQTHMTEFHWLKARVWGTNVHHDNSCPDMASSKGDRFGHLKPGNQVDTPENLHHFCSKTSKSVLDYGQPNEVLGKAFETTGSNTDKSAVIIVSDVDEDNAFGLLPEKAQGSECNLSPNVTSQSSTSFYSFDSYEMNFEDKLEEIDPGYASYSDITKSVPEGVSSGVAVNINQNGMPPNSGESTLNVDHAQINMNVSDLYANPQVLIRKRSQKVHLPKTELLTSLIDDVDLVKDLNMNMESKLKLEDMEDSSKPDHNEESASEPPPLPARNYSLYIEKSEQLDVGRGASSNVESLELNTDSARTRETSTQNISEPCLCPLKKTLETDKLILESVLPTDQNILHYEGNFSEQCDNMHTNQKLDTNDSKPSENDVTYAILPDSDNKAVNKSHLEKASMRENSPLPNTLIQIKSSQQFSDHSKISSYEDIDIPGMSAKIDFDRNDKCDKSNKDSLISDNGDQVSSKHIKEQIEQQKAIVESLITDLRTSNLNDEATDSQCKKISLQISDDDSDEIDDEPSIKYFIRRYHPYESIDDIKAQLDIVETDQDHHTMKSLDFSTTSSNVEKLDTNNLHKNKKDNPCTATCIQNPLMENSDQTELVVFQKLNSDLQTEALLAVHEKGCNDSKVAIENEYTDNNNELENIQPLENIEVGHHSELIGATGVTHAAEEILHSIHSFEELYGRKGEEARLSDIVTFDAAYDKYMYDDNEPTHMTMEEVFARARRSQSPCKLGETTQATRSSQEKKLDIISPCPSYQTNASGIQFYHRISDDWTNLDSAVYDDASDPSPADESQNRTNNVIQSEEASSSPPPVPEHPPPPAVPPRARKHVEPSRPVSGIHQEFMESMQQLKNCGWYWGPLSWEEAEAKLMNKPEGSFLVRDSSDERYILSLSFKSRGHVHHTRIEHHKGRFSFWSQPESHGKSTIKDFVEQCMINSSNGRFLYFIRPSGPGAPPLPIQLIYPVSRFAQMSSLQHMCRFRILQIVRRDHVDQLPIPTRIKEYLREAQYYVESLED